MYEEFFLHTSLFDSCLLTIVCLACSLTTIDVSFVKKPSTRTAQQRLFLVFKVVFNAVIVIPEVLRLSTKVVAAVAAWHISAYINNSHLPRLW